MIRKLKRDMARPQAPHGTSWEIRWRVIWGRQRAEAKGLTGLSMLNESFKAMYGTAMPPGSPTKGTSPFSFYPDSPLFNVFTLER